MSGNYCGGEDIRKGPNARSTGRLTPARFTLLFGSERGPVAALAAGSLLAALTESGILAMIAQVAAALVAGSTRVHLQLGPLTLTATVGTLVLAACGLGMVRMALQVIISVLPARMAADIQARLRSDLFTAFTSAAWSVQARDREGYLQELMTNQITEASAGALQATQLLNAVLTFAVLVISALILNVVAALGILVAAGGVFLLLRPLSTMGHQRAQALSRSYVDYAHGTSEATRLAEETRVFGAGAGQRQRIGVLITSVRDLFFRTQFLLRLVPGIYQSLIYLIIIGGLGVLYAAHTSHLASLGAVVLLLVRAGTYGQTAQLAYQWVRQSLPYFDRLEDAQRRYAEAAPITGRRRLPRVSTLAFTNVSFAYEPSRPVLSEVTFTVRCGETTGIVGPSGVGKTTLAELLLRLRTPTEGRYLINGSPADAFDQDDWHRRFSYVPQEPHLLHASVADNIRYFRDLDKGVVERAARLAGIHEEVAAWPRGYDTIVGPRADAVSGGQQQRICIARALAGEPEVLVLDEPTSALDPYSESVFQASLADIREHLTLFVVAHRISTVDSCDRLMVLMGGRLEAFDTPTELRRSNPYFRSASALALRTPL